MKSKDRGAAAVEMAFTVVLLIWLVFGIIDMGRAIFTNIAVQDAAQAAVAYASYTEGADTTGVEDAAIASSKSLALEPTHINVACAPVTRADRDSSRVRVVIEYPLEYLTPLVGSVLGDELTLTKTVEAERFHPSCDGLEETPW